MDLAQEAMRHLAQRPAPTGPHFTSELSVDELLLVEEAGYRPLGLVLGGSVYRVGARTPRRGGAEELHRFSEALTVGRRMAVRRMREEAEKLGASGVMGIRLEVVSDELGKGVAEFRTTGTAVRGAGRPRAVFTSALSGQDFWALTRAGYAPVALVVGACVHHVAYRAPLMRRGRELPEFTQALYRARSLAMDRLRDEALKSGAEGVVGIDLSCEHRRWGGRTMEVLAVGTAVRPLRAVQSIERPKTVVDLER